MTLRILDFVLSTFILIFVAPIIVVISLMLLSLQGHPIFFSQERVGQNGRLIQVFKFRSMKCGSNFVNECTNESKENQAAERERMRVKSASDPRITPAGRVLRKTHLDELPQLFNVVRGDLSLVGVRPDTPLQQNDYPESYWDKRHQYPPGVTGPDQLIRSQNIAERMNNEELWLENRSLFLYLKYLAMTPAKIFKRSSF